MKRRYTNTELGMMYGVAIGAVLGITLFALTGQPWWLAIIGAGVALGLGLGATRDTREG